MAEFVLGCGRDNKRYGRLNELRIAAMNRGYGTRHRLEANGVIQRHLAAE